MRMLLSCSAALVFAVALVGCGRDVNPTDGQPEDDTTRLGETTDVDVAAWLKLSRPALAKLADEWTASVNHDIDAARNAPDAVELLPKLMPPVSVPIFQQATYSDSAGFSLPAYVKAGTRDGAVALHLARFGDREAALKLAEPGDVDLLNHIDSARYEKDYPLEWSRLIGLVLASSQLKLASGDVEAATRLALVHKQLRSTLDQKAAAGPLGSVLLSAGKRALREAVKAWRHPQVNKTAIAADVEAVLEGWGEVPGPMPGLVPGATKGAVAGVFGVAVPGKAVTVHEPNHRARALDLMALPVPSKEVEVVTAFMDDKDRLAEIQLTYRSHIDNVYPEPIHLAYHLDEHGLSVKAESRGTSLYHQTFVGAGMSFEAMRSNSTNALGGWVRIRPASDPMKTVSTRDLRDFGLVHLDRGFEANRVALVPDKAGSRVSVSSKDALKRLVAGLDAPVPAAAELQREKDHDLVSGMRLVWSAEETAKALVGLLPALWQAFGNASVAPVEDATGAFLAFTWQDDKTRVQLRIPCDEKGPELLVDDTRGKDKLAERALAAHKRDQEERQARLAANKPALRLPRSPGEVNNFSLTGLRLGMSKGAAEAALPVGANYRRKDIPGGVSLVVLTPPLRGMPYWARHIVLRYDDNDRLAEVRLRYQEGLAATRKGESLLEKLSEGPMGAPEVVPASWDGLWSDLPRSRTKVVQLRWQDDATVLTYQRDGGVAGTEVTWTDRAQTDAGKPLGPLVFLKAGVSGCLLGDTREEVQSALKAPVTRTGGAEVHRQPASSPYKMVLVWYVNDKVSRIVAVHRAEASSEEKAALAVLGAAWGRNITAFGYLRWQEGPAREKVASYYWHDDRTRVETYVESTEQGPRLMTEWRSWPLAAKSAADATKVAGKRAG